jgi:galactose-6-phosphate isomerase
MQIDVTSVLLDPMFTDRLTCTRNTQTIGDNGLAVNAGRVTSFIGVVTSDRGYMMQRRAEGTQVSNSILVVTRFNLQDGSTGLDADIVTWQKNKYTVVNTEDYSHAGKGFIQAHCELIPIAGGSL